MATYGIYSSQTPSNPTAGTSSGITLGIAFTTDNSVLATGARYYNPSPQLWDTLTVQMGLWNGSGTLLASGSRVQSSGEPTGWVTVPFSAAVTITSGITYTVAYMAPSGTVPASSNLFFNPVDNTPLHVGSAGGRVNNSNLGTLTYPTSTSSTGYFADIVASDPTVPGGFFALMGRP